MVREESATTSHQLILSPESIAFQPLAEDWLSRIRAQLPDTGTAVVTIHRLSRRKYLVSFRASAFGETFISEVRDDSLEVGVREAGTRLVERLTSSPPLPKPTTIADRVRELFGETG
jgi:hypothetical protein